MYGCFQKILKTDHFCIYKCLIQSYYPDEYFVHIDIHSVILEKYTNTGAADIAKNSQKRMEHLTLHPSHKYFFILCYNNSFGISG